MDCLGMGGTSSCCAPADTSLRDELVAHLAPLLDRRVIQLWHSGNLQPGANIQSETHAQLDRARLVLALTTANLLSSAECTALLQRARRRGALIIPVLARPCFWEVSELAGAQPLPSNRQPVSASHDRDAAWVDVVNGVFAVVSRLPMGHVANPPRAPRR